MTIGKPNTLYFPDREEWVLQEDYFDPVIKIRIPAGFTYDGASVPRLIWAIIDPLDLSEAAALVHDYLYRNAGIDVPVYVFNAELKTAVFCRSCKFSKEFSDEMFRETMIRWGVKQWREVAAFYAVKWFGFIAWRRHEKENKEVSE